MQYCPLCEAELSGSAHFCNHCGYALRTTTLIGKVARKKEFSSADEQSLGGFTFVSRLSILSQKVLNRLPISVQRIIAAVLTRTRDPKPEEATISLPKALVLQVLGLPMLLLISTLGVFSVAYACNSSRNGATISEFFFWLGLLLIFVPATVQLILPVASRFERISLLCVMSTCFYFIKVVISPLYFSAYDEFLQWRTADDIVNSEHLFNKNALLPVSPFYPGLEIVTNALNGLSGLGTFTSGIIVVGVARLVMILALFMLYELVMQSTRMAGIATLLYMANPHFLFFDAAFSYESLAIPLATLMILSIARYVILNREPYQSTLIAWIILGAVVVTHHVTDLIFDGLLLLWAVIYVWQRRSPIQRLHGRLQKSSLLLTAMFGIFMSLAWISLKGNPVVEYLSSYFSDALSELSHILTGASIARPLFVYYNGVHVPQVQRIMVISSVALISLGLLFGLLCIWQRYRHNTLVCMLGIVSLFYPISQVFRFTNFGSEVTDRSSAFLFIAIACVLAILIVQFWPTQGLNWIQVSLITCTISVIFAGGIILGSGAVYGILPGSYLVTADARSIEPEGIQAGVWTYSQLGANNRMMTDRINQILMSTYGDQRLVTPINDKIDGAAIFFSPNLGSYEVSILQQAQVRYLVVDLRLSKALPLIGFYFDEAEPAAFRHSSPIELAYLTKFSTIRQINRVFDSGDIIIYDVGGLINTSGKS